jgi:hypothetical protein
MYVFKEYIIDRNSIIYITKTLILVSKSRIEVRCVVSSSIDGIDGIDGREFDSATSNPPSPQIDNALHGKRTNQKKRAIRTVSTATTYRLSVMNHNYNSNIVAEREQARIRAERRRENR